MIFEGVNFNERVIKKMSREDFVSRHISVLWPNRDEKTRQKMLVQVYDLINPVKPKKEKTDK